MSRRRPPPFALRDRGPPSLLLVVGKETDDHPPIQFPVFCPTRPSAGGQTAGETFHLSNVMNLPGPKAPALLGASSLSAVVVSAVIGAPRGF